MAEDCKTALADRTKQTYKREVISARHRYLQQSRNAIRHFVYNNNSIVVIIRSRNDQLARAKNHSISPPCSQDKTDLGVETSYT